jgi:hypothetical protein
LRRVIYALAETNQNQFLGKMNFRFFHFFLASLAVLAKARIVVRDVR